MKKILFIALFCLSLFTLASAADQGVCGKTFSFFYNDVTYLMKFSNPIEDLPCTSGTATLYWYDKSSNYTFSINSEGFIKVSGVGVMAYYAEKLYFLDTATIIFNEM